MLLYAVKVVSSYHINLQHEAKVILTALNLAVLVNFFSPCNFPSFPTQLPLPPARPPPPSPLGTPPLPTSSYLKDFNSHVLQPSSR